MSPRPGSGSLTVTEVRFSVSSVEEPSITILDWVIALVEDPARLAAFKADPTDVIESDPDLQPRQKQVLNSGDPSRIQWVIVYESNLDPDDVLRMHGIFFIALPSPQSNT